MLSASIGSCLFYSWFSFFSYRLQHVFRKIVVIKEVLKKGVFRYLLILRLVPLFPFWLVNVAATLFRVGIRVFFLATFLGVIPGSYAYTQIGVGLSHLMVAEKMDFFAVFNTPILLGIGVLLLLIIVSFFIRPQQRDEESKEEDIDLYEDDD